MKKILGLTIAALLVMGLVGGGTWAYFSDPETSTGNVLTAGTLDLNIDGGDANKVILVTNITDVIPGSGEVDSTTLNHTGSIVGELDISFSTIDSEENGIIVDAESVDGGDSTSGAGEGELDSNIWFAFWLDYLGTDSWDDPNDVSLNATSTGSKIPYVDGELDSGAATGDGTTTTINVTGSGLTTDAYKGFPITVAGKGTAVCVGNTATTITVATPFDAATEDLDAYTVADGPHYDLAVNYSGDSIDAVVASMADDYDFTIEWVVPVTAGNDIMSDDVSANVTFTLEQIDAD